MKTRKRTSAIPNLLISLLLTLAALSPSPGYCYESSFIIGPNFSQHTLDSATATTFGGSPSSGVGYNFGTTMGFTFDDTWGMELGVLLSKRITSFPANLSFSTSTINIPLLLRISPLVDLRGLTLEIGPYVGILPYSSAIQNGAPVAGSFSTDLVDYGAMGGLTYLVPVSSWISLRASVFYTYGLPDISSGPQEVRVRGLDTYIGLMFR